MRALPWAQARGSIAVGSAQGGGSFSIDAPASLNNNRNTVSASGAVTISLAGKDQEPLVLV